MSGGTKHQKTPRAMIHKRIIDAAAARPDAALAEVADDVPGASTDLVERVLDEYGDPADSESVHANPALTHDAGQEMTPAVTSGESTEEPIASTDNDGSTDKGNATKTENTDSGGVVDDESAGNTGAAPAESRTATETVAMDVAETRASPAEQDTGEGSGETGTGDDDVVVDLDALSEKRRETLRAINVYPDASQRKLAAKLGVTAATISQRVNAISGFEWAERASFVEGLFEETREEFDAAFGIEQSASEPETADRAQSKEIASEAPQPEVTPDAMKTVSDGGQTERDPCLVALEERVDSLEATLADQSRSPAVDNPELLSKVIHACMAAEEIGTEEEHRIIEQLLT